VLRIALVVLAGGAGASESPESASSAPTIRIERRDASHARSRGPEPSPRTAGPTTAAPGPACSDGTFEVERCVTGGMAFQTPEGPRANVSCTTRCESAPPGAPGMPCAQIAPRKFRCNAYAP